MTYLPPFISRSLRITLEPESQYANEDAFIRKLRMVPKNVLLFFQQSFMFRSYFKEHLSLMRKVVITIDEFAFTDILPLNEVIGVYSALFKYTNAPSCLLPADLQIESDGEVFFYTRMVLMKDCAYLRQKWKNKPEKQAGSLKQFAKYISNISEFNALYTCLMMQDSYLYRYLPNSSLVHFAVQLSFWGYSQGSLTFENELCKRVKYVSELFTLYAVSKMYALELLFKFCKNALDNFDYYSFCDKETNRYCTAHFLITDTDVISQFDAFELRLHADDYLENLSESCAMPLGRLMWVEISLREGAATVRGWELEDFHQILEFRTKCRALKKKKLDPKTVDHLKIDGNSSLTEENITGMLHYFEHVKSLSFFNFKKIMPSFCTEIGKIRGEITMLSFLDFDEIEENVLIQIPIFFRELTTLQLNKVNISAEVFRYILSIESLENLDLKMSVVSIPENAQKELSRLKHLCLSDSIVRRDELILLLKGLSNVQSLILNGTKSFKLDLIEHAQSVVKLDIDCDQLKNSSLNVFDRFANLKIMHLYGQPDENIKKTLFPLMKRCKIHFMRDVK